MNTKLYTKNTNGTINVWWAEVVGDSYLTHYGRVDGKIQTTLPVTCQAKNVGKKNETSGHDQAMKEVEALYVKQRKMNYFDRIEDVDLAWQGPMLCAKFKDRQSKINWSNGQIIDQKLNGVRCVITRHGARSRTNEVFHAIPHILEALQPFFTQNPDAVLDGELYNPMYVTELSKLCELVAVTRKEKDITPELLEESAKIVEHHVYDGYGYDGVTKETPFKVRRDKLRALPIFGPSVQLVEDQLVFSEADALAYADAYIAKGGEGIIIKDLNAPYVNKRSNHCIKYKKFESEEFEVISLEEGNGNWTGCAKFVWCKLPNGLKDDKFKSNIKGEREHLRRAFQNRDEYVGKMITVEFQEYSIYNVPLIPYTDLIPRTYE